MKLTLRPRPDGFRRIRTRLQALMLDEGDRRGPVLRVLDATHIQQVRRAFGSRGASVATGPWPPWSPKYAKWRSKHRGRLGNRMMRYTDTLFEKAVSPTHPNHIAAWLGAFRYAFGFRDDVGWRHQEGGAILPKRSLIDKTEQDRRDFAAAFVRFYRARIRQVLRTV